MMNIRVLLVNFLFYVLTGALSFSDTVYFESHGRDDLREWRAALAKGAQYIKIDFNFQSNATLCLAQSRIPRGYNATLGCLLLCHDYETWQTEFNTTFDIVDFLKDDANLELLTARPVVFQMCLKNEDCPSDCAQSRWLALMKDFYNAVEPLLSDPHRLRGRVQFVFDSIDGCKCALDMFGKWNTTWVGDPASAADNVGQHERAQMVNLDYTSSTWKWLAVHRDAKFVNSTYAMVAWEPFYEAILVDFYAEVKAAREAAGLAPHAAGQLMAYNGDPSMFHVFTSAASQRYTHRSVGVPSSMTPIAVWVGGGGMRTLLVISNIANSPGVVQGSLHARGARGVLSVKSVALWNVPTGDGLEWLSGGWERDFNKANATSSILVMGRGLCGLGLTVNIAVGSLVSPPTIVCLPPTVPKGSIWAHTSSGGGSVLSAFAWENSLWVVSSHTSNGTLTLASLPWRVVANVSDVDGLSLAVSGTNATILWSGKRSVFAATLTASAGWKERPNVIPSLGSAPVMVGVGRQPSIAITMSGSGVPYILAVYGNSFCYNTVAVDDDGFIFSGQKICNLADSPVFEIFNNPVLVYVFAAYDDWVERIAGIASGRRKNPRNGLATVCDDVVLHGAFDLGYNASVILAPRGADDADIAVGGFLAVAALTSLTEPTVCICGAPIPQSGRAMVDSFPLFGFYNASM